MTVIDLWTDHTLRGSVATAFAAVGPDRSVL